MSYLVLAVQLLIRNMGWEVSVENCTESQAIIPAAAEVCDVNILEEKKKNKSNIKIVI